MTGLDDLFDLHAAEQLLQAEKEDKEKAARFAALPKGEQDRILAELALGDAAHVVLLTLGASAAGCAAGFVELHGALKLCFARDHFRVSCICI